MFCKLARSGYGKDTRPTQVLNLATSVAWLMAIALDALSVITVSLPDTLREDGRSACAVAGVAAILTILGFCTRGRPHQLFKSVGLLTGSLLQCVLANAFFKAYPPLDMMLIVCLVQLLWYLGALYYIVRCEGLYDRC